jgi:hypothetical protein
VSQYAELTYFCYKIKRHHVALASRMVVVTKDIAMEKRVLEAIGEKTWMWTEELQKYFSACDVRTHYVATIPGFVEAVDSLCSQGIIRVVHRLEIKGKYKICGETIEKRSQESEVI